MADDEQMITVLFKGARDPANRTETITLRGRDSIPKGGQGQVTAEEYGILVSQTGLVLEVVESEVEDKPADEPKQASRRGSKSEAVAEADESVPAV